MLWIVVTARPFYSSFLPTRLHEQTRQNIAALVPSILTDNTGTAAVAVCAVAAAAAAVYYPRYSIGSSSTATPLGLLYMFLLAVQYSIQPVISKMFIDSRIQKENISIVEELVKMTMGLFVFFFFTRPNNVLMECLQGERLYMRKADQHC